MIYSLLRNRKVHSRVHNSPPLTSTLSHIKPVHILPPYFLVIHFNILFPPTHRPSTRFILSGIPTDIPHCLSYACCILRPSLSNNIQNIKILPFTVLSASYHFLLHRSKSSPQHIVRKHPQIMLYSQCYRPRYIQQAQLYFFVF